MDAFEQLVKTVLEQQGYWVRSSYKVDVTKEEKREIGKPSIPRPEIDLLAYKPGQGVIALEVKSYLDSGGVELRKLTEQHETPDGRFKLFTCANYRKVVFSRLRKQLRAEAMLQANEKIQLGLAAGNVYRQDEPGLAQLFSRNGWFWMPPADVKAGLTALAAGSYENDPYIIATKLLLR